MRRLLAAIPWVLGGLLLGLAVHIMSVFTLPRLAADDAAARLVPFARVNEMVAASGPDLPPLPLADPAFEMAICRYDLRAGALRVRAPLTATYTAIAFHTATGVAYQAINDRAATRRTIDLYVLTPAQRRQAPSDDDATRADNLFITAPSPEGFVVIRALAAQPGMAPVVREQLAREARCGVVPVDQIGR